MYDVIIVGAGPAGSVCARTCAKQGLSTLLLDRDAFPRTKPCGGAVAVRALSFLNAPLPPEVVDGDCRAAVVRLRRHRVDIEKSERFAVLVNRSRFDAFLAGQAREAGARFAEREQVSGVVQRADRVEVTANGRSYEARYVVGADGALSVVARSVRPVLAMREMALALVCTAPRAAGTGAEERDTRLDLRFGIAPLGYGWDFPHGKERSVGVIGRASNFVRPREVFAAYAREVGAEPDDVRGHFIPYGGFRRRVVSGRILLAGDAAVVISLCVAGVQADGLGKAGLGLARAVHPPEDCGKVHPEVGFRGPGLDELSQDPLRPLEITLCQQCESLAPPLLDRSVRRQGLGVGVPALSCARIDRASGDGGNAHDCCDEKSGSRMERCSGNPGHRGRG